MTTPKHHATKICHFNYVDENVECVSNAKYNLKDALILFKTTWRNHANMTANEGEQFDYFWMQRSLRMTSYVMLAFLQKNNSFQIPNAI